MVWIADDRIHAVPAREPLAEPLVVLGREELRVDAGELHEMVGSLPVCVLLRVVVMERLRLGRLGRQTTYAVATTSIWRP